MSRKVYWVAVLAVFIAVAGLVAAQMVGTKPAAGAVVKAKAKPVTVEQRIIDLAKNQDKILTELKEIKQTEAQILKLCRIIFNRMDRR